MNTPYAYAWLSGEHTIFVRHISGMKPGENGIPADAELLFKRVPGFPKNPVKFLRKYSLYVQFFITVDEVFNHPNMKVENALKRILHARHHLKDKLK